MIQYLELMGMVRSASISLKVEIENRFANLKSKAELLSIMLYTTGSIHLPHTEIA